jgi:hypothetical protein
VEANSVLTHRAYRADAAAEGLAGEAQAANDAAAAGRDAEAFRGKEAEEEADDGLDVVTLDAEEGRENSYDEAEAEAGPGMVLDGGVGHDRQASAVKSRLLILVAYVAGGPFLLILEVEVAYVALDVEVSYLASLLHLGCSKSSSEASQLPSSALVDDPDVVFPLSPRNPHPPQSAAVASPCWHWTELAAQDH